MLEADLLSCRSVVAHPAAMGSVTRIIIIRSVVLIIYFGSAVLLPIVIVINHSKAEKKKRCGEDCPCHTALDLLLRLGC